MEFKIKKKTQKKSRRQQLLDLLKVLKMDEVAEVKVDARRAHSDRSILSRLSGEEKIGFGSSYENGVFKVWKEKYVSAEEKKNKSKTRAMARTPKVLDPRIEKLKVGGSFVVKGVTTADSEMSKLRRQARHIGMSIKCVQQGDDVVVKRLA